MYNNKYMKTNNHNDHNDWKHSLVKTLLYRAIIIILDFSFIYFVSKSLDLALGFMIVSNTYTGVIYFFMSESGRR